MPKKNEKSKTPKQVVPDQAQQEEVSQTPEAEAQRGADKEEGTPTEGEQKESPETPEEPQTPSGEGEPAQAQEAPQKASDLDRKDGSQGWIGGHTLSPTPPGFKQNESLKR